MPVPSSWIAKHKFVRYKFEVEFTTLQLTQLLTVFQITTFDEMLWKWWMVTVRCGGVTQETLHHRTITINLFHFLWQHPSSSSSSTLSAVRRVTTDGYSIIEWGVWYFVDNSTMSQPCPQQSGAYFTAILPIIRSYKTIRLPFSSVTEVGVIAFETPSILWLWL